MGIPVLIAGESGSGKTYSITWDWDENGKCRDICWDDERDKEWLDSSESISVEDEFYEYYEQLCADYHCLFNFNKMGGVSLCGSVSKHDVNVVDFVREVLQIYKEIVRDLREKAIQNF